YSESWSIWFGGVIVGRSSASYTSHSNVTIQCNTIFFFNATATTEIYTLSLHDALPIYDRRTSAHPAVASKKERRRQDDSCSNNLPIYISENAIMIIPAVALTLFVILVAVTLMGGRLRRLLPAEQLSTESKDAVKLALGLVATMTAILLGLLISSAKSAFDTARSEVIQMAAKVALLDRVLVLYGPETADARRALRDATDEGVRRTWPAERGGTVRLDPNQQMGDAVYGAISRLAPQNEAERALKTQAANLMVQLAELRSLLQAQAVSSVSKPLLIALVLWLVVIFFGFSLLAPANATSTLALIAGAFSVVCAVFIILELDYP